MTLISSFLNRFKTFLELILFFNCYDHFIIIIIIIIIIVIIKGHKMWFLITQDKFVEGLADNCGFDSFLAQRFNNLITCIFWFLIPTVAKRSLAGDVNFILYKIENINTRFSYIMTLNCNLSTDINSSPLSIDGKLSNTCTGVNNINSKNIYKLIWVNQEMKLPLVIYAMTFSRWRRTVVGNWWQIIRNLFFETSKWTQEGRLVAGVMKN